MDLSYESVRRRPARPIKVLPGGPALHLLEQSLNPISPQLRSLRDPVIVSIDLEFSSKFISQVGIATLDTRILRRLDVEDDTALANAIASRLFLLTKTYIPRNTYTRQYIFGDPEPINGKLLEISMVKNATYLWLDTIFGKTSEV